MPHGLCFLPCRRHRCPHGASNPNRVINKKDQGNCKVSEYRGQFKTVHPRRGPFYKPTDLITPSGEQLKETTHRAEFIPREVKPPMRKEPEKYVPNPHKFDTVSEHRDHFTGTRGAAARIPGYLRGITMRAPSARVDYKSVSHGDYKFWAPEPIAHITRANTYAPPSEPFRETSIHRQDFKRFNEPPRPTARQPDKIALRGSVADVTSYKTDFMAKELPARFVKEKEVYNPPAEPFNSTSIVRDDFKDPRGAKKASLCRWNDDFFKSSNPMQHETTNNTTFRDWGAKPRQQKEPESYQKPEGTMDCRTTHMDYCFFGEKAKPARTARPRTKLRFGRENPLDDTTNYSTDFQWRPQPVTFSGGPTVENEVLPKGGRSGFDGTSESLDKYKRFNVVPPKSYRDNSTLFKSADRINGGTSYRGDYSWPKVQCPSDALFSGQSSEFVFDHQTEEGHKIFSMPDVNKNVAGLTAA